jgi:hypothetical protein
MNWVAEEEENDEEGVPEEEEDNEGEGGRDWRDNVLMRCMTRILKRIWTMMIWRCQ